VKEREREKSKREALRARKAGVLSDNPKRCKCSAWDCMATSRAHQLEELLRGFHVVPRPRVLAHARVHHALEDVLLRRRRLEVFEELKRFVHAVVPEVTDKERERERERLRRLACRV
jgi:hypothetical protein